MEKYSRADIANFDPSEEVNSMDMNEVATQFNQPILQFFVYAHLPEHLQVVSRQFALMAIFICENTDKNPEQTAALRKLLESKDAAVRARLIK